MEYLREWSEKHGKTNGKSERGLWHLRGVSWEQLQEGHVITKDMSQKIYGALAKLKDYEETGLDPGEVEEAVQRLTP